MATKVKDITLKELTKPIDVESRYQHYHLLIRTEHQPIGWISFWNLAGKAAITEKEIYYAIQTQLTANLIKPALSRRLGFQKKEMVSWPKISVVICTRNRCDNLRRCLNSFTTVQYEHFEIIVVDNAPTNEDTYQLVSTFPVRYVREDRPGLDWARNCGISEASYEIVAFTDDDALVDPHWLEALARAFSDPEVMAVTGFVAPSELETHAQHVFEFGYGGMGHGFARKTIKKNNLSARELLWASGFGVGANMAFRKQVFQHIGNFDVALDVGTASHGGGDIEMFHRLVHRDYKLVYEPAAIIWHTHRREMTALKKQVFDNGRSFGCYLITCLHSGSVKTKTVIRFLVIDWFKNWICRNLIRPRRQFPRKLALIEFWGMITSPFAYIISQANAKKIITSVPTNKYKRQ
jgi:glycosyltransferase involved in cell wall biosynthesis